ncbi:hypothetical protein CXB51_025461 [Gossypium anomalum]|uniref:Uncharacterized protein n=1 Tax=Gossypium anomalum TaxID=47600 RepID=A0A8J6CMU9_9ROSI|nr:hypothetical protein CXB51_025461 [Gossypium anomalum]
MTLGTQQQPIDILFSVQPPKIVNMKPNSSDGLSREGEDDVTCCPATTKKGGGGFMNML